MPLPGSVLIVRLSSIGDVIHSLPVLNALRQAGGPEAKIGWIVEELSAPLLEGHPQISKLYVVPKKQWKGNIGTAILKEIKPFFDQVKADGWDIALDVQGLTKSGLVAKASGARLRVGFGDEDGRELNKLFTNLKVSPPEYLQHIVERNLNLLTAIGVQAPKNTPAVLSFPEEEKEEMRKKLKKNGWDGEAPFVLMNPGGGWESKRWKPESIVHVGVALSTNPGLVPVILWGPGEEALRDCITSLLKDKGVKYVVAPETGVRELAVLISLASFYFGGDTGPSHMAGALGIPNVTLFGPSDGRRNRPWPISTGQMIQRDELECIKCWKTVCPKEGHQYMACLNGMSPGFVIEEARKVWKERLLNR